MVSVRINGEEAPIQAANCSQMADVVELIKSIIDPDHMITAITLDGQPFDDNDWGMPVNQLETAIVEVETGEPFQFVHDRLSKSGNIVQSCFLEFRAARQKFQDGKSVEGNKQLVGAVQALQAFFQWYGTLLELVPLDKRDNFDLTKEVEDLSETCKAICQQQLYQSWWALGESIQQKLEPQLDELEKRCRSFQF
ncbi:MAG: hypothetical protein KDD70_06060 [Bdellovibrionales bacterium]|nr:hypothetical protein [Bdellovibrionales bacterium]